MLSLIDLDEPEATKTSLNELLTMISQVHMSQNNALVIHYTDAPPHCVDNVSDNYDLEKKALEDHSIAGFDWIAICKMFRALAVPVFTFTTMYVKFPWYHLLGTVIRLSTMKNANFISFATIQLLLRLTGNQVDYDPDDYTIEILDTDLCNWKEEQDAADLLCGKDIASLVKRLNTVEPIVKILSPISQITEWFRQDTRYRDTVFASLKDLLDQKFGRILTVDPIIGKFEYFLRFLVGGSIFPIFKVNSGDWFLRNGWIQDCLIYIIL
jgi:hypothetical protein